MAMNALFVLGPLIILLFFVLIAFAIFLFIAWILMIIDCIQRRFNSDGDKIVWILVLIFIPLLGLALYYFLVFRKSLKKRRR